MTYYLYVNDYLYVTVNSVFENYMVKKFLDLFQ